MAKLELMSPAGSLESIYAAARAGADAIYFGGGDFNARRNAKNFSNEELEEAIKYLKIRGKHSYITVNTLLTDRELKELYGFLKFLNEAGASAVIVQDLAVAKMIHTAFPDMPMHASTQLTVHNLAGALQMKELGFSRVVLSRELPLSEIKYITENCGIETEVFVHGALCMCYSGQCYFSGLVGGRSGNRGLCAQPCRMQYGVGNGQQKAVLSLKDLCLAEQLNELVKAGVSCAKIEGRMKRPEYTAYVTNVYRKAIDSGKMPTRDEMDKLRTLFSRDGFTQGYFNDKKGSDMFGMREEGDPKKLKAIYKEAQALYAGEEDPSIPVDAYVYAHSGEKIRISMRTHDGYAYECYGMVPEKANHRPTGSEEIVNSLKKTGGTAFYMADVKVDMEYGLKIPLSAINAMRRQALDALTAQRKVQQPRRELEWHAGYMRTNSKEKPKYIFSYTKTEQITRKALMSKPEYIYIPLAECYNNIQAFEKLRKTGQKIAVVMNRIMYDREWPEVKKQLEAVKDAGIDSVVCTNVGHPYQLRDMGFELRGDFGLNVFNSQTMKQFRSLGVNCQTLSFELNFAQIRDISKCCESELIVYGRLPLMITENCAIKNRTGKCSCKDGYGEITDKTGRTFPIMREEGCRNTIYNSDMLFWADKKSQYSNIGITYARLNFTTENGYECDKVIGAYVNDEAYMPERMTRGLYQRGVE